MVQNEDWHHKIDINGWPMKVICLAYRVNWRRNMHTWCERLRRGSKIACYTSRYVSLNPTGDYGDKTQFALHKCTKEHLRMRINLSLSWNEQVIRKDRKNLTSTCPRHISGITSTISKTQKLYSSLRTQNHLPQRVVLKKGQSLNIKEAC